MTDTTPAKTKKTADKPEATPAVNDDQDATVGTEPAKPAPKAEPKSAEPKAT